MNSQLFISRTAELLIKHMRKEITKEEKNELDRLIAGDEKIKKLFDNVNDPEYMRQQINMMWQINEQTDHKKNLQKLVDGGVIKSDENIFTYVRLNGNPNEYSQYESCIRMLIADLEIVLFQFTIKTERSNSILAYHFIFAHDLLHSEIHDIIRQWSLLLQGMGLPIDDKIKLERMTKEGLDQVSKYILRYK